MVKNKYALDMRNKLLLSILIVFSILFFTNSFAITYDPQWYDLNQSYRTEFNITLATTDLTNVTLNININESFMGSYFNFSTHRNSTRIYYYNGSDYIEAHHYAIYWSETNNNATLQFIAPFISSTTETRYYIYFGNSVYSNIEDECSTYIYCDYFDDSSINSRLSTADLDTVGGTAFSESSGSLSITAGGADTWTGSDEYGSVYLTGIEGDVDVRLSILSQTNPNPWCKAGIMIRNDMTAATTSTGYSFTVITPGNAYSFQRDENNNGYLDSNSQGGNPSIVPSHVRLVKTGTTHIGYYSKTDQNSWNQINSRTITSTNNLQDIGISLTSHAGSTTATATFDNFTVRRYHTDSFNYSSGNKEKLINYLSANISSPSLSLIHLVQQNQTIDINATIICNSYTGDSCYNVTGYIQYNDSLTSFINVLDTSSSPVWTNINKQSCILDAGQNCSVGFKINMTGQKNSYHKLRIVFSSNISDIENVTTMNVSTRIIVGNAVNFNVSFYNFSSITKYFGDKTRSFSVISNFGDNTNIRVECESGDCGEFSDNFLDGISLLEGNSNGFDISCLDNTDGSHYAIFNVTSDEYETASYLELACIVEPLYGPISAILNTPITDIKVQQNSTFILNATASCIGICGKISAYLMYQNNDWYNKSYNYRQNINFSSTVNTQENYQLLIRFNSSNIGANFNWSNSCNDLLFIYNNTELSYWVQNCSTSSQVLDVWVKSNTNITTSNNYGIEMYYGNNNAISKSNASETFRVDEIFFITGNCPSTSGFCNMMDNHADSDGIKTNIGSGLYTIYGQGYVTQISHPNNPFGSDDDYYSRYRFLFIPQSSGTFWFGTASDDGSDAGIFPLDGYGGGIRTTHPHGQHDVVTDWYGGHASGTCGSSAAIERSRSLTAGSGYWIDYTQQERGGGQDAQMCIRFGGSGSYPIVNSANFAGEIFAREYVTPEPVISEITEEESLIVSTTNPDLPLFTYSSQPQTCNMAEGGSCSFEWIVNATGSINSSYNLQVYFESNYSNVDSNITISRLVNITDMVIPFINITYPINNLKLISDGKVNFSWIVEDDDALINASFYLNNVTDTTIECVTGNNCSYTLNLSRGNYEFYLMVNDSDGNVVNSSKYNFTIIYDYDFSVSKRISSISNDMYFITNTINNNLNYLNEIDLIDFVDHRFNYGSFNYAFDWINLTTGYYTGDLLGWNFSILKNDSINVTYSITKNDNEYYLLDEFIIGLD